MVGGMKGKEEGPYNARYRRTGVDHGRYRRGKGKKKGSPRQGSEEQSNSGKKKAKLGNEI